MKKLKAKIKMLRDWAKKEAVKHDDGRTNYGDTDMLASDVQFGRAEAFDEVLEMIKKQWKVDKSYKSIYESDLLSDLTIITGREWEVTNCKKISIPNFLGTGGCYEWIRIEDKNFDTYITGLMINGFFVNASVGNQMKIAGAVGGYKPNEAMNDIKAISKKIIEKGL